MSYEIVKSISIKNNQVYLRSCSNNITPKTYEPWISKSLTNTYQSEGKDGLYELIGHILWDGDIRLQKGNKLCSLFIEAKSYLPNDLTHTNISPYAIGVYFKNAVKALEKDSKANLTKEVTNLLAVRDKKSYLIEGAEMYGINYLNYANKNLQHDREFAMEVVKASRGSAHFEFPTYFTKDKEFAMKALEYNGCWYRQLDKELQIDHDIILKAFDNSIERRYVEHLPDTIPNEAFYYGESKETQSLNKTFLYTLMEVSPKMHMNRASYLIQDEDSCIKWYQYSKFKNEAMMLIVNTLDAEILASLPFQKELFMTCEDSIDQEVLIDLLNNYEIPLQEQAFKKDRILKWK